MLTAQSWKTFWYLLQTDLKILRSTVHDKIIDLSIWVVSATFVMGYLLPAFGISQEYGPFMLAGICATAGHFEVYPSVMNLVTDFTGDRIVSYYLTLPMPSYLVFIRLIIYYAFNAFLLGMVALPVGKLMLWNRFSITDVHVGKFIVIFLLTCFFYGALTLLVASFVPNVNRIGIVWMRFLYPLWEFGCFAFAWSTLYDFSQPIAYLMLLNPFTYIMEGMRGALLGWSGSLPFIWCAVMLLLFALASGYVGVVRLKRRLDFV